MSWWQLASASRPDRIPEGATRVVVARRAYADACIAAREALIAGNAAHAVAVLDPAVSELPAGIDANRLLGIALLESNEPARARRPFEVALEGDPHDLVAQVGLAEVEEATEARAVAFRAWRRAWELEPGFEPVVTRLRELRRHLGAEGTAGVGPLTADASGDGPIVHTLPSLARVRLRAGLSHHAILDAMEALRQDRTRVDVKLLLAEAWWRAGDTEVAHDVAASVLETTPGCVAANLLVALHRRVVSRDPRQQVEVARKADPFDRIAHQLFAGRDIPPIMDDAWNGDQWSASHASFGDWPVVAMMPRTVAIERAAIAAERAAAEAAAEAAAAAAEEAARQKAAAAAAAKPGAGAFKGTGVIADPGPGKPGGAAGAVPPAEPPKPGGFKGTGLITDDEAKPPPARRRPVPPAPPTIPAPAPAATPDPGSVEPTAQTPSQADHPEPEPGPLTPVATPAVPPVNDQARPVAGARGDASVPSLDAATGSSPARADHDRSSAERTPPTVEAPRPVTTKRLTDAGQRDPAAVPDRRGPGAQPTTPAARNALDDLPVEALRQAADQAFRDRDYAEAVRRYAALLRRE